MATQQNNLVPNTFWTNENDFESSLPATDITGISELDYMQLMNDLSTNVLSNACENVVNGTQPFFSVDPSWNVSRNPFIPEPLTTLGK